jgi:threonylcarbamoyladenosine tRNA methylthiotransferase MtaB
LPDSLELERVKVFDMKATQTIKITTLGCKVNQCESDAIIRALQQKGLAIETDGKAPDICIVNTCTVTQKASMQSRQAIRKAIKTYPNAKIVVTGCYAQTAPQEIADIKGVSVVIGNTDKLNLPALLTQQDLAIKRLPTIIHHNISRQTHFKTSAVVAHGSRTRPFLKIQDGCNAGCTYCIVPHARGPNRSMPLKSVLMHLDQLNQAGFEEIVLTGIHLGCYGQDFTPPLTFLNLLKTIDRVQPASRVRLSSIEPMELSAEIIDLVAVSKIFCRHFHVPLQSGDNTILKKMKRPYLSEDYHQKILQIHSKIPDAAIGADIIVGFPGETDAAFNQTLSLIASLPVSYLHVFPFSARKHTPAYSYPNKVPERITKKRCKILRELGQVKKRQFYSQQIGQTVTILVEGTRDRDSGKLKGLSTNYIPVLIDGDNSLQNTLVEAEITEVTPNLKVIGKP